ncbi:MAG: DUF116 domain-containing protein [Candidatus Bathyarchaeota archaeon]|nr:DUF116 domain-containing protein [Candidatus Bathyarchaeota archaeon]
MRAIEKLAKLRLSEVALSRFERIAAKMGVDENRVLELYITAKNNSGRERFKNSRYSDRILLLPQCLRSRDCTAKLGELGYECNNCGKCKIGSFINEARTLGYEKILIISGGSIVPKIFTKFKPKASLGVGCFKELVMGSFVCEKFGIAGQGFPLLKDGCLETDLDWISLKSMI